MTTPFHAKFWAESLRLKRSHEDVAGLARSIANARVDLNPHQVDAALFALRSPFSKGVLLADEVGLGKTIEAALVISQRWAERRRRILLVVPATLRKQWALELETKFYLPTQILETKTFNELQRKLGKNPFEAEESVVIASYNFVYAKRLEVQSVAWDLVVVDEAHRLRNVYKEPKTILGTVEAIRPARKLLLTATPLQNSLLELYGLISILDPELFGGLDAFRAQFVSDNGDAEERYAQLRERIKHIYTRTLRRQVLEYVPFTERRALTLDFIPTDTEQSLYDRVSEYLRRDELIALPNSQRKLITLILRKLLASSSAAIGATLAKFARRLEAAPSRPVRTPAPVPVAASGPVLDELAQDFETTSEEEDEWGEDPILARAAADPFAVAAELNDLREFVELASSIPRDAKADKLLEALTRAFTLGAEKGAARKAVVFTESCQTQRALFELLSQNGYANEIVLMNGTNSDDVSRRIYSEWKKRNEARWHEVSSGSRTADMKAAIVEEFRDRGTILLATESAAEGVNLQFCSIVVNYDLPWNPQRIEQRIGRCHRYGQKCEVVVVNFLNRKNAADERVFQLLSQKFRLFEGVFGASDEVLGALESGVDLEKAIAEIYQQCRTSEQIQTAFDDLQRQLDAQIQERLANTKKALLENVDEEVIAKLRIHAKGARLALDEQQRALLELARFELGDLAEFADDEPRFRVRSGTDEGAYDLDWKRAEEAGSAFFRPDGPLAAKLIEAARSRETRASTVRFTFEPKASALDRWRGCSGWLAVERLKTTVVGREEEHLLVAAVTDAGEDLPGDVGPRFFSLTGAVEGNGIGDPPSTLSAHCDALVTECLQQAEQRSAKFLDEEEQKLEHWSEDLKVGLEQRIRALDREIPLAKKDVRKLATLAEKVEAQKKVAALESERNKLKREFFERQDEIESKRESLLETLQDQIKDRKSDRTQILTLRWKLDSSGRPASSLETRFRALVDEWKTKSRHMSSPKQMWDLPAYQAIVALGTEAVPLLLEELRREPDFWFWALHAITGQNPVPKEAEGRLDLMTAAWLSWGRAQGLVR